MDGCMARWGPVTYARGLQRPDPARHPQPPAAPLGLLPAIPHHALIRTSCCLCLALL